MHIEIVGYRKWAEAVYYLLKTQYSDIHFCKDIQSACQGKYTVAFFVGWSDLVSSEYYSATDSFVVHPSPLPYYRGGSPIQHQIINGETVSAVSIFKLSEEYQAIDSGPIAVQIPYSLEGNLDTVLHNMTIASYRAILDVIYVIESKTLALLPQKQNNVSVYKRRKPEDSQITKEELETGSAKYLYNKIRALQDPYPNAFIQTSNGKLFITRAHYEE